MSSRDGSHFEAKVHTDVKGNAEFWLDNEAEYRVVVASPGFKKRELKSLRITKGSESFPTAYVQFQLDLSGPFVTVE